MMENWLSGQILCESGEANSAGLSFTNKLINTMSAA